MDNKLKMPKTFFTDDYPLFEKVGRANFTIKLKYANKLHYSPEQFGKGLDRGMKILLRDAERQMLNTVQMEELQFMSREDRMKHMDWVMKTLDNYIRARSGFLVEAMEELYTDYN